MLFTFLSFFLGLGSGNIPFSCGELLHQRIKQPHVKHPQVEQRAELRSWVCPHPSVSLSPPTSTPAGAREASATCSASSSTCNRIMQAPTVPQSSEWLIGRMFACLNCRHSPTQCPFTGVEVSWWCLCPRLTERMSCISFGMGASTEMRQVSGSTSAISSVHLAVDTRSQSTLSV